MNSTKITTVYLTNVEDTLQIKSYFELYEGIFNNIDFSSKNENLELQLNNYCNSLNSAIKSILEYIKTHNVDVEYYRMLARKINNILYEFKNKMQEFGIAIDNSENIREAYLFYKAIAKSENLLPVKTYLYNSDEREKEFLDYIKIEVQETKEAEVKESVLDPKKFLFINEFDKVNEDLIYKHFYENLVDKGYLTNKELETFLIEAFNKKNIPSIKFDFKNIPNKKTIINIFYTYFMLAQKPHGKKSQYVKLLTDYFNGYEYNNTLTNFAKHYY